MSLRQYVYFALISDSITAAEITAFVGVEPDETRVSRQTGHHRWKVVCREPALTVDQQIDRVVERLAPYAGRIAELGESVSAVLQVVRYFNDDEEHAASGANIFGWHLERDVLDFLAATGAELDVDEYDMTDAGAPYHLDTERLELLPLKLKFAEEMAAVLDDPELPVEALRARYLRQIHGSPEPGVTWSNWVIRLRGEGQLVGFVQATLGGGTAEVAWVVGEPWRRRGIAAEAAGELVRSLVLEDGVREIVAHIDPENLASGAVAKAVGLVPTSESQDGEVRWRMDVSGR